MARSVSFFGALLFVFVLTLTPFFIPVSVAGSLFAVSIAFLLFACSFALIRGTLEIAASLRPLVFVGAPLLLIACVSIFKTGGIIQPVFGTGFELGTVGSFFLFALLILVGSLGNRLTFALFLYGIEAIGFMGAFVAALLWFGLVSVEAVPVLWPQASFVLGAAMLVASVLYTSTQTRWLKVFHIIAAVVIFGGFVIVFLLPAVVAAMAAGFLFLFSRRAPLNTAVVSILLGLLIVLVVGIRAPLIALPGEVRPSFVATEYVVGHEYLDSLSNALIGTGPASLSFAWNRYRPAELNATSFWSITPEHSYSTAMTLAIELGLLGLFAFFLCPFVILGVALVRLRSTELRTENNGLLSSLYALGLLCFLSSVVYPISLPLALAGGLALGGCVRLTAAVPTAPVARSPRWAMVVVVVIMLCTGGALMLVSVRQIAGTWYNAQGKAMLESDDLGSAVALLGRAAWFWGASSYRQDAALAYARKALHELQENPSRSSAAIAEQDLGRAATLVNLTVRSEPKNPSAWFFRASLYLELSEYGIQGVADLAEQSLDEAATLAPTRPDILYLKARLALVRGDDAEARELLNKALELKSGYVEAETLLGRLGE